MEKHEENIKQAAIALRQKLWCEGKSEYYKDRLDEFKKLLFEEENKVCNSYSDREMFRTSFLFESEQNARIFQIFMDGCMHAIRDEIGIGVARDCA